MSPNAAVRTAILPTCRCIQKRRFSKVSSLARALQNGALPMKQTSLFPKPASKPTREEIAAAAYQLYLESGCQNGHDLEHWLRAEQLLARGSEPQRTAAESQPAASAKSRTAAWTSVAQSAKSQPAREIRPPARATPWRSNRIGSQKHVTM